MEIISWPEDKKKRRKVLIATLEYEIIDWKLKVKIGGLSVMSRLEVSVSCQDWRSQCHVKFDGQINDRHQFDLGCS